MQKEVILKTTLIVTSCGAAGLCVFASRVIAQVQDTSQKRKNYIDVLIDVITAYEPYVPEDIVTQTREMVQFEVIKREYESD